MSNFFNDPALPRSRRLHFEARRAPGAGAWLTVTTASHETHFLSPLSKVALRRRICMPVWDHDSACGMCGEVLDQWDDHALSCCGGGDRALRHNAVRDVVCSTVSEYTSATSELEKPGLLLPRGVRALNSTTTLDVWVSRGVSSFAEAWRRLRLLSGGILLPHLFPETRKRTFQDTASQGEALEATFRPLVLVPCGGDWSLPPRSRRLDLH